jgi:hypothetical protein
MHAHSASSTNTTCRATQEKKLTEEVEAAQQALQDLQQGNRSSSTQTYLDAAQAQLAAATQKAEAAKESHSKVRWQDY